MCYVYWSEKGPECFNEHVIIDVNVNKPQPNSAAVNFPFDRITNQMFSVYIQRITRRWIIDTVKKTRHDIILNGIILEVIGNLAII